VSSVTKVVETVFRTVDHASAPMAALASVAMRTGSALTSVVNPLTAIIGGLGVIGASTALAQMHSEAENTTGVIAGMFQTFGMVSDFNDGLTMADQTLARIAAASASLPGEAQDYINTFQLGFTNFQSKFGDDVDAALQFSNQMTAVASALSVPAQQISTDVARLTQAGRGGAGADVLTWQRLLPYVNAYRQSQHQSTLNAEQFNKLTQEQRIELMRNVVTMESLTNVIDRAKGSWESMTGGFKSATQMIARQATIPLFEGAKEALGFINGLLMEEDGSLTAMAQQWVQIGQNISTYVVEGIRRATAHIQAMGDAMKQFGEQVMQSAWFSNLVEGANRIVGAVSSFAGNADVEQAAIGGAARVLLGPIGALVGPLLAFAEHTDAVSSTLNSLTGVFYSLTPLLEPFIALMGDVNHLFGDLLAILLPSIAGAFDAVAGPLTEFGLTLFAVVDTVLTQVWPMFTGLATSVAGLVQAIGSFLAPIIRLLGAGLIWVYSHVSAYLMPAVNGVVDALKWLIDGIAKVLRWIGRHADGAANNLLGPRMNEGAGQSADLMGRLDGMMAALTRNTQATEQQVQAQTNANRANRRATPAARGGNNTHNDFRNSRFQITQKFAEGFDPDRVAIAFARDLEAAADQRLQSGLEPAFGIR
jgi:hypothetical protein